MSGVTNWVADHDLGARVLGKESIFRSPSDPPPPPDTSKINAEQLAANLASAQSTNNLNNPNLINQYGTTTFTNGTNPGDRGTMTQTLSPEQQSLYETGVENKQGFGDLANQGLDSMQGLIGSQFDLSGAPAAPVGADATRQKVIDAMMSRSDKRLNQASEQQDSDLIARGIRPGTEAWDRVKGEQSMARNDAYSQAELTAGQEASRSFGMDTEARKNAIAELLTQRQTPFNEVQALLSGSQVANPFAGQGFQAGASVQPVNTMGSANMLNQYNQDIYNQKVGANNSGTSALATIGAAYFSDRRLKTNIKRIGTHKLGIGLYKWTYVWGQKAAGVMADEVRKVMPQAISNMGGYDAVDYAMIGA